MEMTPDDVHHGNRSPRSRAEEESRFAVANELPEQGGNRRVKIDLTVGIRRLETLFDFTAADLLLDVESQKIGGDVLIDFEA
jgi:hypothetical protein